MSESIRERTLRVLEILSNTAIKQLEFIQQKYPDIFEESYYASFGVIKK